METEKIVQELIDATEQHGLIPTLAAVFGPRITVSVPLSAKTLNRDIEDFDFSVRSSNALRRSSLAKIDAIVDAILAEELMNVRNLGKKSYNEILTRVLVFGYDKLSVTERREFFHDVLLRNT